MAIPSSEDAPPLLEPLGSEVASGPKPYEILLEIANSLLLQQDLAKLVQSVFVRLRESGKFDALSLILHDSVSNVMRLRVSRAPSFTAVEPSETPVGDSPAGWVWQNQKPLLLRDLGAETAFSSYVHTLRENGIRSYYVLPVATAERSYGAVCFGSLQANAYSDSDLRFMEQLSTHITVAVDVSMARETVTAYKERLSTQHERLHLVHDVTNALVSHLDAKELFGQISKCVERVVKHDYASLCFYDPAKNQFHIQALDFGEGKDVIRMGIAFDADDSPSGEVLATRKPLLVSQLSLQSFPSKMTEMFLDEGIKSGCWLPLVGRNRFLGTLNTCSFRESAFSHEDLELLSEIAGQVAVAVDNALAFQEIAELKNKLAEEKTYLEDEIQTEHNFQEIVGESSALKRVLQQVAIVANTDSTVLILGETGTGKELIARAIHNLSNRRARTLVKLNCAAIPTGLLESELFGHEKGAFTGAIAQKVGRVELADKGTLFLDEVGDIPLELQPKLLRVLQEQEFERLGATRTIKVDVRFVVATNRDLDTMVAQHTFREDLFYRLNVFPIHVPPLRERPGDIPLLVNFFVTKHAKRIGRHIEEIPTDTMHALCNWHWPGNVRELENVIERALIVSQGPVLTLPYPGLSGGAQSSASRQPAQTLEASEREIILRALRDANGVVATAALKLGMKRTTLNARMRKLHISRRDLYLR